MDNAYQEMKLPLVLTLSVWSRYDTRWSTITELFQSVAVHFMNSSRTPLGVQGCSTPRAEKSI